MYTTSTDSVQRHHRLPNIQDGGQLTGSGFNLAISPNNVVVPN